jgi:HAD superfamily hydrolase (TIGR01458 family)
VEAARIAARGREGLLGPRPAAPGGVKGFLFDIDGVLEYRGRVYPGAVETLQALRARGFMVRYLTNSTLKSRRSCAEDLRRAGFAAEPGEVITASYATARYLSALQPRSCWVLLAPESDGLEEFRDLARDEESPEYLVVGNHRAHFDFACLNRALRVLRNGAKFIAMHYEELTDTSMDEPELTVGSWAQMLERASGVPALCIGKPSPYVFELALDGTGLRPGEVVMVGDRMSTDVAGAHRSGLRAALVRTGEYDERTLAGNAQPDWVLDSVADVLGLI